MENGAICLCLFPIYKTNQTKQEQRRLQLSFPAPDKKFSGRPEGKSNSSYRCPPSRRVILSLVHVNGTIKNVRNMDVSRELAKFPELPLFVERVEVLDFRWSRILMSHYIEQTQDLRLLLHARDVFSSQKLEEIAFPLSNFRPQTQSNMQDSPWWERRQHYRLRTASPHLYQHNMDDWMSNELCVSLIISVKYTCQIQTYDKNWGAWV